MSPPPELQPPLPSGEHAPALRGRGSGPPPPRPPPRPGASRQSRAEQEACFPAELGCSLRRSMCRPMSLFCLFLDHREKRAESRRTISERPAVPGEPAPSLIGSPPGPAPSERGAQCPPVTSCADPCSAGPLTPGGPGLTGITDLGLIHNLQVLSLEETAPQSFQENLAPSHLSTCHLEKNKPKLKSL